MRKKIAFFVCSFSILPYCEHILLFSFTRNEKIKKILKKYIFFEFCILQFYCFSIIITVGMFHFVYGDIDFAHKINIMEEPAEDYDKHLHYFNEIVYFVSGKVRYTVEDQTRSLRPGDIVFIHPGQYHFAGVDESIPYERYVLKFPESALPESMKSLTAPKESFFGNSGQFSWIFSQLDMYYGKYSDEETKLLFLCEVVKLIILLTGEKNAEHAKESNLISNIIAYIHTHIKDPISLDTLNREFNFSKSYISNEFRKAMKIPVMQYIRAKKIIAGHQMILSGAKRTEVAETLGFENYSTFYRAYVAVMGFPPAGERFKKNTQNKKIKQ